MSNQANIASWITAIVLPLSLVPPAHGQTQAPTMNNRIGDITNNQGIITQGQTGNNTIINPINRDANGVYQGNTKVGSAPPPVVDEPTGIATFQAVTFTSILTHHGRLNTATCFYPQIPRHVRARIPSLALLP